MKIKGMNEAQFLSLLKKVLPKATKDPHLASAIYDNRQFNSVDETRFIGR